jgi:argininosuccinate lyase
MTMMKGLPMTYNRDMQEDKEPLFDTVDTLKSCLQIMGQMGGHLKFNREKMLQSASGGFSTATDVAEYLVMKGLPFREAHAVVGRIVAHCIEKNVCMQDLSIKEFRQFHKDFCRGVYTCLQVKNAVNAKKSLGGTARDLVRKRIHDIQRTESD